MQGTFYAMSVQPKHYFIDSILLNAMEKFDNGAKRFRPIGWRPHY